ncbi:DNA-binding protein [Sphingopyxis lindanitolerans]|uniref:Heat shock protein HspQ n=1 Tax=Sphingopyxis lindanitolerans TaxID=2054227 RepID=A0A2S8B400_9SPHN|nr:heat shock protein HspQ [Sphingopyxis lindanitolerans]PQM27087.1 DNA-binding protein [Sphingopyxis lindanitolerans]
MTSESFPEFRDRALRHGAAPLIERARFAPGDIVRHRMFDFRGVVFDVDPTFANSDEWYEAIPEAIRPAKEQPYYHLLAESEDSAYIAYVSQQNLVNDTEHGPVDHPQIEAMFDGLVKGRYRVRPIHRH